MSNSKFVNDRLDCYFGYIFDYWGEDRCLYHAVLKEHNVTIWVMGC